VTAQPYGSPSGFFLFILRFFWNEFEKMEKVEKVKKIQVIPLIILSQKSQKSKEAKKPQKSQCITSFHIFKILIKNT